MIKLRLNKPKLNPIAYKKINQLTKARLNTMKFMESSDARSPRRSN